MARPFIKWPGGKTKELDAILPCVPEYDRYIEPFFGGGAVFFALEPKRALINDLSRDLMEFYVLTAMQDGMLKSYLTDYAESFFSVQDAAKLHYPELYSAYSGYMAGGVTDASFSEETGRIVESMMPDIFRCFSCGLVRDGKAFEQQLKKYVADKLLRTAEHERKKPISDEDRTDCFITGFTSGYYMYFRNVYNDIMLNRGPLYDQAYCAANFYFIREYCYGSMFRYNRAGEFNIPYGGISYNKKNLFSKIETVFSDETRKLFSGTEVYCMDFEDFLKAAEPGENDFMFLDPPYDTDFSDYEGNAFLHRDHERLAGALSETKAKFLLVIKDTEFIGSLYKGKFNVRTFDNNYSYNVKSRNDRSATHLIVTNY